MHTPGEPDLMLAALAELAARQQALSHVLTLLAEATAARAGDQQPAPRG